MNKLKERNIRKRVVLISSIALICIFIIGILLKLDAINKKVARIAITPVNFSNLKDGIYQGECIVEDFVGAKIQVSIEDGKLKELKLIDHKYGLGKKAEKIIDSVIEEQTLEVDAISGATCSSKLILKAIENAVKNDGNR